MKWVTGHLMLGNRRWVLQRQRPPEPWHGAPLPTPSNTRVNCLRRLLEAAPPRDLSARLPSPIVVGSTYGICICTCACTCIDCTASFAACLGVIAHLALPPTLPCLPSFTQHYPTQPYLILPTRYRAPPLKVQAPSSPASTADGARITARLIPSITPPPPSTSTDTSSTWRVQETMTSLYASLRLSLFALAPPGLHRRRPHAHGARLTRPSRSNSSSSATRA
jgi:hypothetical protein